MDDDDKYTRITLRIPKDLHGRLSEEAEKTSKSMNAEILARLESSFRSVDVENAASILLENQHLKDKLRLSEGHVLMGELAHRYLADTLVRAIDLLPKENQVPYAGTRALAVAIRDDDALGMKSGFDHLVNKDKPARGFLIDAMAQLEPGVGWESVVRELPKSNQPIRVEVRGMKGVIVSSADPDGTPEFIPDNKPQPAKKRPS